MMPYSTKLALFLIALAVAAAATTTRATILLPDQFHCSTELWLFDREKSSEKNLFIDEYVDRANRRSSLRITDASGIDFIYYNQLFGTENGPIERQFVRYEPRKLTCARQDIYSLSLDRVRQLAIGIMPTDNLSSRNVDIAIGPSGLMYAIENRLNELEYRGSAFDESRLIYTDIYELSIAKPFGEFYNSGKDLLIQVSTFIRNREIFPGDQIRGKTLADVAHAALYKLHLVSVKICSVSEAKVKRRTMLAEPYKCQTGNNFDSQQQELDLVASFNLVEDLINDSLIGQPLDKAAQFDFELNPFAQPEGLGCGKSSSNRVTYSQRPSSAKSFKPEANQFSAEYFSLNGLSGLSFVAYDGDRQVLRHDRAGRSNIYDLARGRSYHADEFHSLKSMFDQSQPLNCVELEIGVDMLLDPDLGISAMARLLGVDFGQEAAHIGTKIINDESFTVYELELVAPNLPILMEPIDFVLPANHADKTGSRFFMTYFVSEIPSGDPAAVGEGVVKIPRFVELWELTEEGASAAVGGGASDRRRSLINLLEFTQFTWSLNIQPEEEDVAKGGVDDLSRVFSLESCALGRAEQLLLSFNAIHSSVPAKYIRANQQLIKETYHEQLATCLDIPRTNLFALDLHLPSPDETQTGVWLLRARVGELVRGLEQDTLEGYVAFNRAQPWLVASRLFKGENRHSYDQCKLDSLSMKKANAIVYCPGLTTCLIVDAQAVDEHRAELLGSDMRASEDTCEVHKYTWRPTPSVRSDERGSVLARVFENKNRILRTNFVVELEPPAEGRTDRDKPIKLVGFGHGVKIQTLDDTVGRQMAAHLSGVRYVAASEDSTQGNSNYAHKLLAGAGQRQQQQDNFRHCHMVCQMDEYCESFSVCKQAAPSMSGDRDFDCVLSTMRLTNAKISDLAAELKQSSQEAIVSISVGSSSFDTDTDEANGQVFKFRRAPGCGLHSKDILAQFRVEKSLSLPINLDATDRDLLKTPGANVVSLDECAGIANELALMETNSLDARFVYCPMESLCLSGDAQTSLEARAADASSSSARMEKCFLYSKSHHLNFYDYTLFRKVALHFNGSYALEDDAVQRIGRVFEGLSVEQCARDCNLQQSKCLAFDMCEFETNVTVCTLYTIRSPLAPKTKAGYLPDEERFYGAKKSSGDGGDSATLVENGKCAHFQLKDSYLRLKIQQLLDTDSVAQRQRLDELEQKLLAMDSKLSDDKMMESILGNKAKSSSDSTAQPARQQVKESSSGSGGGGGGLMIHLMLIISSAVCGALGYLYSGEAKTLTVDTIVYLRARRGQRFAEPRISQLNLSDNLHADL